MIITNEDLQNNNYEIDVLIKNILILDSRILLKTQKLTGEFCKKYILNPEYISCQEENDWFSIARILKYQPHILIEELNN